MWKPLNTTSKRLETMAQVLITGSEGFIGRHVADLCLSKGNKVIGLDFNAPKVKKPGVNHATANLAIWDEKWAELFNGRPIQCKNSLINHQA